jgi:hypothetical protein
MARAMRADGQCTISVDADIGFFAGAASRFEAAHRIGAPDN